MDVTHLEDAEIRRCDALELLRSLPDGSVDAIITDPPYNIGLSKEWDVIPDYVRWMTDFFNEAARVTPLNGQLLFWHNNFVTLGELWHALAHETPWRVASVIVCYKPTYRVLTWKAETDANTLRSWFNICELVTCCEKECAPGVSATGLERIHSLPEFSAELRGYMCAELARSGMTAAQLVPSFREWGGGTGAILRHYFISSQWLLPTRDIYEGYFQGRLREVAGVPDLYPRGYDELRAAFEEQRAAFEEQRAAHNVDPEHHNVMRWDELNDGKAHPCQKPLAIMQRLVRVHTRKGDLVCDPFLGSGTTAAAALLEGRRIIGSERDEGYYQMSVARCRDALQRDALFRASNIEIPREQPPLKQQTFDIE